MEQTKEPPKSGWRVREWADAAAISRSSVYNLITEGRIKFVKYGSATIIRTSPADWLDTLRDDGGEQ